jgi:hypothetical protein
MGSTPPVTVAVTVARPPVSAQAYGSEGIVPEVIPSTIYTLIVSVTVPEAQPEAVPETT